MSFPRLYARTRRFTLGVPRNFTISPDGARVVFLRSRSGTDPVTCLWEFDVEAGEERLLFDPGAGDETLPPEERARRERLREAAGGVVAYATDDAVARVVFALSGELHVFEDGSVRSVQTPGGVIDPRLSPDGRQVAYVSGGALHVQDLGSGEDRIVAAEDGVTYGLAEFIASEEMDRHRGYWWSPDSDALLVARVDESPVERWHIGDPANPSVAPVEQRYPAAGTANALVSLFVIGLDGSRVAVPYEDEYLATAAWDEHGLTIVTMPRDQKALRLFSVDAGSGALELVREDRDEAWVDIIPGTPAHVSGGALVWTVNDAEARRLVIGDELVTPVSLQVRDVIGVDGDNGGTVYFRGGTEPVEIDVWSYAGGALTQLTSGSVANAVAKGGTVVLASATLDDETTVVQVLRSGVVRGHIASLAERPGIDPQVRFIRAGTRALSTAVLFPAGHEPGSERLPILMDPYGGPHAQRVLASRRMFLEPQWWADQGFAVIVTDGRGTPGRGPAFEREVYHDLTPALEDQVDALMGVAARYPDDLDLGRVAIRGWSFGGYLAALAVLRRPDVFQAAVAGAPVTDWRLYDTCYTERYLGQPSEGFYEASSLLADAEKLERPLLLVHGLADDNVVAAHTLRLSSALLAAGRPHTLLPLSGVTHMTPQEVVAENLLLLQLDFLRRALAG